MSKSTSMLPTLAGGSGVAAHTLADADLMKVVDAETLNADRDRKVTLAELRAFLSAPNYTLYTMAESAYTQALTNDILEITDLDASVVYALEGSVEVRNGASETLPPKTLNITVTDASGDRVTYYSGGIVQDANFPRYTLNIPKILIASSTIVTIKAYGIVGTGGGAQYRVTPRILLSRVPA